MSLSVWLLSFEQVIFPLSWWHLELVRFVMFLATLSLKIQSKQNKCYTSYKTYLSSMSILSILKVLVNVYVLTFLLSDLSRKYSPNWSDYTPSQSQSVRGSVSCVTRFLLLHSNLSYKHIADKLVGCFLFSFFSLWNENKVSDSRTDECLKFHLLKWNALPVMTVELSLYVLVK